ncbi:MAG: transposase [bacterium]|nr:transposase [bacterium]
MAYRREEFAHEEWYHCYTRSIDKKTVFEVRADYERFLQALYVCNGTRTIRRGTMYNPSHDLLLSLPRGRPLVAIGAYCLMPNHFHLLLQEITDDGISTFMQKVGTSFSMYFNVKRQHVGNVFVKPFRAKHINDDRYLQHVAQYIHLNPAELFEREWKSGAVRNVRSLEQKLKTYRYSSLPDYEGVERPENSILDTGVMSMFDKRPSLSDMLVGAAEYYADLPL